MAAIQTIEGLRARAQDALANGRQLVRKGSAWVAENGPELLETAGKFGLSIIDGTFEKRMQEAGIHVDDFIRRFGIDKRLGLPEAGRDVLRYSLQIHWLKYQIKQRKQDTVTDPTTRRRDQWIDRTIVAEDVVKAAHVDLDAHLQHVDLGRFSITELHSLAKHLVPPWMTMESVISDDVVAKKRNEIDKTLNLFAAKMPLPNTI